jgi:hypothetical protein
MLPSVSSVASTSSSSYLDDSTQDPTSPQNPSAQTNPEPQSKPVNTASAVASLRELQQSIAKRLKKAIAQAMAGGPAAKTTVAMLTVQLTAIEAQISDIVGLNSMRAQEQPVTGLRSNINGESLRTQRAQRLQQVTKTREPQPRNPANAVADSNATSGAKAKPFRFDLTGTFIDDVA